METFKDKQTQVVLFSSTAIALYGYDQGMMSLINTNKNYLSTMAIREDDPLVGLIVSIYYLGCAVGAVIFSRLADVYGRKIGIFLCLATASLGNLIMFLAGIGLVHAPYPLVVMFAGRVVMGLGVGGIDSVIPVYSSELSEDKQRGKALAQEFQMNIFGLNMAFGINLGVTIALGKESEWAWRIPIVVMQVYPFLLFAFSFLLPESPRWFIFHDRKDDAHNSLAAIYGPDDAQSQLDDLIKTQKEEEDKHSSVSYLQMLTPSHPMFHPTVITIMGQINQALTGYGAVSVYGPQIFELLGFHVRTAEYLTQANYLSYFLLMTFAWLLIDAIGRRKISLGGSLVLTISFLFLTIFGWLSMFARDSRDVNIQIPGILGTVTLFIATGAFGIGWLVPPWLVPTEIFPTTARTQGTAISVIIWGIMNFIITLLTPIFFNNLSYFIFLIFAGTNLVAGLATYLYLPESGNRSFEENQKFFEDARTAGTWNVRRVKQGGYCVLPYPKKRHEDGGEEGEREPLLGRVRDQMPGGGEEEE